MIIHKAAEKVSDNIPHPFIIHDKNSWQTKNTTPLRCLINKRLFIKHLKQTSMLISITLKSLLRQVSTVSIQYLTGILAITVRQRSVLR